jgi:hypothetical protein
MINKCLFCGVFLFCGVAQAIAQAGATTGTIADVSFIEGSWKAVAGDRNIDAVWSVPNGENIVGYVRVVRNEKVALYEMFAFEQTQQGLVALVRHFGPGLIAREEKETPNLYHFMEAGNGWAMFQKQGEDVRVRYEKRSEDEFAIVVGRLKEGKWVFEDFWKFSRVK